MALQQLGLSALGTRVHFVGGPTDTGMRITTEAPVPVAPGQQAYSRMTFTLNADGSVLQHGETSPDGQTWTTSYAFIYRRHTE